MIYNPIFMKLALCLQIFVEGDKLGHMLTGCFFVKFTYLRGISPYILHK